MHNTGTLTPSLWATCLKSQHLAAHFNSLVTCVHADVKSESPIKENTHPGAQPSTSWTLPYLHLSLSQIKPAA
ncbi:hypothetical protein E2C01_033883 [Portunus trituberculatus]|uniref:Uncharacterized protein n=1 Tax=Portunus trituberculatus TaxID=210409 RepID=A0A5B7F449_PORTR|nr:hypothetical protein [Portunus trituberculatus]